MQWEPDSSNICTLASYPILSILLWLLAFFALVYYFLSKYKKKLMVNRINCLIFLPAPLIFLTRSFLLFNYWYLLHPSLMAVTFITLSTNCILSLIFKTYYLSLFEENLRNFQGYMKVYPRFYKIVIVMTIIIGPKMAKIFSTGLIWAPKSNFEKLPPFMFSLNRLLNYSLILSVA